MLYGVSNSSNTTGSTYNLVFMQRSISLYRALKNTRFSSTSPTRIFGDFWYVIEDMFLDQKPLKNLLLQLVAGWPTFCDKMPGLLPSPQSAVCIFCSVRSLYSLHKGNRLVLLFIYFSQNPTDPGIPCFPQTPSARRPCIPAPYYPLNPIWLRAVSYNLGVAQIE